MRGCVSFGCKVFSEFQPIRKNKSMFQKFCEQTDQRAIDACTDDGADTDAFQMRKEKRSS